MKTHKVCMLVIFVVLVVFGAHYLAHHQGQSLVPGM